MTATPYAADLARIRSAALRIRDHVHHTPAVTCASLDQLAGRKLVFKCENFQKGGAFKARGAHNAIFRLKDEIAARGVVTHSSGNHAQAVALAARARGIPAHIVMPSDSTEVKIRAVRGYGARVVLCEPNLEARETTAQGLLDETGGVLIHPYDDPDVIAGQGTLALELLEDRPDLDAIVAPVGGGGMISGVTLAARELRPDLAIYGAEPTGADDAARSKQAGTLIPQTGPDTVADGLRTGLGDFTWPVIRDHVKEIYTVSDRAIVRAMRHLYERAKLVVEPSAAIGLAVVLDPAFSDVEADTVGIILTGGNVDLDNLPWHLA